MEYVHRLAIRAWCAGTRRPIVSPTFQLCKRLGRCHLTEQPRLLAQFDAGAPPQHLHHWAALCRIFVGCLVVRAQNLWGAAHERASARILTLADGPMATLGHVCNDGPTMQRHLCSFEQHTQARGRTLRHKASVNAYHAGTKGMLLNGADAASFRASGRCEIEQRETHPLAKSQSISACPVQCACVCLPHVFSPLRCSVMARCSLHGRCNGVGGTEVADAPDAKNFTNRKQTPADKQVAPNAALMRRATCHGLTHTPAGTIRAHL